jgi:hypothetical protein
MDTKICSKCKIEKTLSEFHKKSTAISGRASHCKECRNVVSRLKYQNNTEVMKQSAKEYRLNHKEKIREHNKKYLRKKRRIDPVFRAKDNCKRRINQFYRGLGKSKRTTELLGCTWQELMLHLERQFVDGMSRDNYGLWHIDHIIPLASAKTIEESEKLCHYTNLQPLWAEDNRIKSDKLDWSKDIVVHQEGH